MTPIRSIASFKCSGDRWLYRLVWRMLECPRSSLTVLSGTPSATSQEANECRRLWTLRVSLRPAFFLAR
jgi:hypothetical protein